ncbi:hypothetical protein PINS_up021317 [Pythium insidiosum]|nr:hypothetical protein PINS_up021317 [Pythium insidiosum]
MNGTRPDDETSDTGLTTLTIVVIIAAGGHCSCNSLQLASAAGADAVDEPNRSALRAVGSSGLSGEEHIRRRGHCQVCRHSTARLRWRSLGVQVKRVDDPVIAAVRIPFDKVVMGAVISRGGFGRGLPRGRTTARQFAIKRLLPERRRDLRQIERFLEEVKLNAALEHKCIVRFVGVAWDSLSDLSVVSEFMEGGDLRAALGRFDEEQRATGFDAVKIKIALHVAHALT